MRAPCLSGPSFSSPVVRVVEQRGESRIPLLDTGAEERVEGCLHSGRARALEGFERPNHQRRLSRRADRSVDPVPVAAANSRWPSRSSRRVRSEALRGTGEGWRVYAQRDVRSSQLVLVPCRRRSATSDGRAHVGPCDPTSRFPPHHDVPLSTEEGQQLPFGIENGCRVDLMGRVVPEFRIQHNVGAAGADHIRTTTRVLGSSDHASVSCHGSCALRRFRDPPNIGCGGARHAETIGRRCLTGVLWRYPGLNPLE